MAWAAGEEEEAEETEVADIGKRRGPDNGQRHGALLSAMSARLLRHGGKTASLNQFQFNSCWRLIDRNFKTKECRNPSQAGAASYSFSITGFGFSAARLAYTRIP